MGIIIGNQENVAPEVEQPVVETPKEVVEEPKTVEQPAEEPVAPSEDITLQQEAAKPVRRSRKRK